MNLRRRPKPEKVREVLSPVASEFAAEIIRLRGAMKQAHDLLEPCESRAVAEAKVLLRDTLEREGWWR